MTEMIKTPRPEKVAEVERLREMFERSSAVILADFRGIDVKGMLALRRKLRGADASFRVVKNTLLKRAAQGLPAEPLVENLEGPTAVAYTEGDAVGVAKVLSDFARESKVLKIKGGIAEGCIMDQDQLRDLASLPPRQVLIGQLVGSLQSPISSLIWTMERLYSDFVYTLKSVADKKQ